MKSIEAFDYEMKINQLTILFISFLFLLSSCKKENELSNNGFLQKEWKVQSVVNEGKRFMIPTDHTLLKEAYILKFINDSCYALATSVNYGEGKYQIVSENYMMISDYMSTLIGGGYVYQRNFDDQLIAAFNGVMNYSYIGNKLIFRGDKNKEVVFKAK